MNSTGIPGSPQAVIIGCSAGGIDILHKILPSLPTDFPVPVVVISHVGTAGGGYLIDALRRGCRMPLIEAEERRKAKAGTIYLAPADYHLLVEADHTFSLSVDAKVNNARPSIDVFMIAAAEAWGRGLVAVLLTGANADGAVGMSAVRSAGGLCMVQEPLGAFAPEMPQAAIDRGGVDWIVPPDRIGFMITSLCTSSGRASLS